MSFTGKLFRFFIYSNLFIALCAVLMVMQTYELLLHTIPDIYFSGFVFFSTITSYSFHWYFTPANIESFSSREQWHVKYRNVHAVLFILGIAGAIITGFFLLSYWKWLLLSAFITFLYSAPKVPHPLFKILGNVAMGKTIFLAFVWMYVTTILPLIISNQSWHVSFTLFAISRFFLVYAICILFDYRDREYDKSIGIRSLITWMSDKGITRLFITSLLIFTISTLWMLPFEYSPFTIMLLLIPGFITALLYRYAQRNFSDILYYFVLDGLMALSALMTLLFAIKHSN